jgi:hypothetical protein
MFSDISGGFFVDICLIKNNFAVQKLENVYGTHY